MRVLVTHELYLPDYAGGGEYLVRRTAECLASTGYDVRVLTTGNPAQTSFGGIPTHRLPVHRYAFNLAVHKIVRHARDVDLIQTFNYHACLPSLAAGRILGKPVVCLVLAAFAEAWKEMKGNFAGSAWMRWERFLLTQPYARTIFLGDHARELGFKMGVQPERAATLPIGLDLEDYKPAPKKENVVLFVGKLDVRKGVYDFLAVARALPETEFWMMGWGPEEQQLKARATPNVKFLGYEHGRYMEEVFSRAAIYMLPSKAESFPIGLLQAMASGCAVIFTIPLGFEGALVTAGDTAAMIEAVRKLWSNPEHAAELGRRNFQLAQEYSWEQYGRKLVRIYDEVLGGRKNG